MSKILHLMPGRARLRIEALRGHPGLAQRLRTRLEAVTQVRRVTVNTRTGSLFLLYDPRALWSPAFLEEISAALETLFPGRVAPGHLRLTVRRLKGKPELARALETSLAPVRGIHRIAIDPANGNCDLAYDSKVVTSPEFLGALSNALSPLLPPVKLRRMLTLAGLHLR